jgi:hypothetical protein
MRSPSMFWALVSTQCLVAYQYIPQQAAVPTTRRSSSSSCSTHTVAAASQASSFWDSTTPEQDHSSSPANGAATRPPSDASNASTTAPRDLSHRHVAASHDQGVIHPAGYGSRLQAQHPHCAAHGRKRKGEPERLASKRRRSKARPMRESPVPFGVLVPLRCFVCTLTDGGEGCNHGMPFSTPSEAAPFQTPYKVSREPIADDDRSPIGGSQHRETRLRIHNLLQPLSLSTVSCMPTAAGPQ